VLSVRLVGRVVHLVCTVVRMFFRRSFTRKGPNFCRWGSLWRLFGSSTGEICTDRPCFMYGKVVGWFSRPPLSGGIGSRQQKQRLRAPRRRSRPPSRGGFGGVWLPSLHFASGARAFCSCLPCGQRRRVFWRVSRRGQERATSSHMVKMVTTARSCACRRAWLRLEWDCAMMMSLIDT